MKRIGGRDVALARIQRPGEQALKSYVPAGVALFERYDAAEAGGQSRNACQT